MSTATRLRPEDAARLHMSVPRNPMVIVAALLLEGKLGFESLLGIVEERLLRHARFRQRIVLTRFGFGSPRWLEDADFDLRRHVHRVKLPSGQGERAVCEFVSSLSSSPLDPSRPRWDIHLLEGDDGDALVVRIHHVLADGAALVSILEGFADDGGSAVPKGPQNVEARTRSIALRAQKMLLGVASAARLALRGRDPRTPLSGSLGIEKRMLASGARSLDDLKASAHAHDTTLAPLVLASIAGALRGSVSAGVSELHALVPVSLRARSHDEIGNRYASVFVPLPLRLADASERVREVHDALHTMREGRWVAAGARLASAAGASTPRIERLGVALFSRRATLMVSVVRGPDRKLRLSGVPVRDLLVWAPAPGSIALAITLMSYAGRARIAVSADARVVRDPSSILEGIEAELDKLRSGPRLTVS